MSLGRRKIRLEDASAWIFNRMADVYASRPPYPEALVDAIADLAGRRGARIADLGAGIGHFALPLAERGFDVVAVEPAQAMLDQLRTTAAARQLGVCALRATAESLPMERGAADLVLVADALHFMDKELAAAEVARVLAPGGALALVTSEFSDTPFMRGIVSIMEAAAPRRPRAVLPAILQVAAIAGVRLEAPRRYSDETAVDALTLERILKSISFIGPAMNATRFAAFQERIHAIRAAAVWARTFTLYSGRRRNAARRRAGP